MIMLGGGFANLIYRGVDISSEVAPMVTSINYTDHWHGEADEIDVTVQNKDGRWFGSWFPEHGDTMQLLISDDGISFVDCGIFELDEPDASGSRGGDTMTLRGLAAPITKSLRTQNTVAHENKSLKQIVSDTAGRAGLSLEGKIDQLNYKYIQQRREKDLEFLTRLAEETGHYFSVRGKRAIFTNYQSIDSRKPAITVHREDKESENAPLLDYSGLKFQSTGTYSKGSIAYADPDKKENITHDETDERIKTGDELKIRGERVESDAHAKAKLKAAMHMANRLHKVGTFQLKGTMRALAGNIFGIGGFGRYNGNFVIDTSSHALSRGGYTTSVEVTSAKQ
jgi:phage protein D